MKETIEKVCPRCGREEGYDLAWRGIEYPAIEVQEQSVLNALAGIKKVIEVEGLSATDAKLACESAMKIYINKEGKS
jgi:hypothetical protein